ncbi:alpha-tocopherol transfer protein [Tribolium castaneum]|uniref:Alpha-tocopherol transfer protein-like Protein n=1 Tax=Tribolium castaneum TaxID=7070 RepID=D6WKH1_TRICA|nr:Alpha-tocopherol transfer protein-like Protein [Tribolium castaneum]
MHYTLKTITPEIYENRDPMRPEIQKVLSVGPMLPLPKLSHPAGPRISLARNSLVREHDLDQAAVFKVSAMIQDILLLEDDNLAVAGTTLLHDMSNLSMTHVLSSVSPALVKKIMTCVQYGYPNRIKSAVFFNVTPVFDAVHKIFKPFLTDKVRDRIRICKNIDNLYEVVPKEVLPEEFGGDGGKMEDIVQHWKAKVESYRDWFLEDAKYGTNEKKRAGKPKTSESIYGLDGSFRQLSVD